MGEGDDIRVVVRETDEINTGYIVKIDCRIRLPYGRYLVKSTLSI